MRTVRQTSVHVSTSANSRSPPAFPIVPDQKDGTGILCPKTGSLVVRAESSIALSGSGRDVNEGATATCVVDGTTEDEDTVVVVVGSNTPVTDGDVPLTDSSGGSR